MSKPTALTPAVEKIEADNDRTVLTVFTKHPNRALAVPEIAMLLGGQASFNIEASFIRLEKEAKIYRTASEFHVGPGEGDEVDKSPRYRRVT